MWERLEVTQDPDDSCCGSLGKRFHHIDNILVMAGDSIKSLRHAYNDVFAKSAAYYVSTKYVLAERDDPVAEALSVVFGLHASYIVLV